MDSLQSNSCAQSSTSSAKHSPILKFEKQAKAWKYQKLSSHCVYMDLQPSGEGYILSRLHRSYMSQYNQILADHLSANEFRDFMIEINTILMNYWPSKTVIYLAYGLLLFTCGFSLMLPLCCLNQAEKYLQWKIDEYNIKWERKGVKIGWSEKHLKIFIKTTKVNDSYDYSSDEIIV